MLLQYQTAPARFHLVQASVVALVPVQLNKGFASCRDYFCISEDLRSRHGFLTININPDLKVGANIISLILVSVDDNTDLGRNLNLLMEKLLYRGVSRLMHDRGDGLKPKGLSLRIVARHGQSYATYGSGIVHGSSIINGIIAHQTDSKRFPTSGISTTPHLQIAKAYATHENQKGLVYEIDPGKFAQLDIEAYEVKRWVKFPNKPADEEVILRHKYDETISCEIITRIIEIE